MKLNWGHKIILIYSLFVVMIGFFVYRSIHEGFDLESPDYYDKEVKYQQQINREQNTLALREKPEAGYLKTEQAVEVRFPLSMDPLKISGEINFFKPDNASLDFSVRINLKENNIQKIDAKELKPGAWKVRTSWTNNSVPYYHEEKIFIN